MSVSERFACRVTGQNRTTQQRPPTPTTPADPDAPLRDWLQGWAKDHPRRGFRNAYHDARDEGWHVNHKKIQRLWREEGLRVPQQRRRKRLGTSTTPNPPKADAPNRVWAVDFQFDATTDGRPVKIVSIVDEHTRECLGGPGRALHYRRGPPRRTGPHRRRAQLPGRAALRQWPRAGLPGHGRLGRRTCRAVVHPARRALAQRYVESFNSRIRDECLNINILWSLAQGRVVISDWKEDYNHRRRHSSLGYQAPAAYAATCAHR